MRGVISELRESIVINLGVRKTNMTKFLVLVSLIYNRRIYFIFSGLRKKYAF